MAPLIARMDADDRMHSDRLAIQWAYMQAHPEVDLVASRVEIFPAETVQEGMRAYLGWQDQCMTPEEIANEIYWESPIVHPSVMFRRQRVVELGGYREGAFPEDYELWLRMVAAGCRMAKVPEVLLWWRESATRVTRTDPRCGVEALSRLRAEYLARDARVRGVRPVVIWGAGRATRRRVEPLLQHGMEVAAWVDVDPRKQGRYYHGAQVRPPSWLAPRTHEVRPFVLACVTVRGARGLIAAALEEMGYRKGEDYLMVG